MEVCVTYAFLCLLVATLPKLLNIHSSLEVLPQDLTDCETFDFIVVGAGTTGCAVAGRLSEINEWSVLLLEAGGEEPYLVDVPAFITSSWETLLDWQYKTVPDENYCGGQPCVWNSGKVMGGTGILNGMIYNRGNPLSYDEWNVPGWAFNEVLPKFKKSENNGDPSIAANTEYHAVGGPQNIQRLPYQDKNVNPLIDAFKELRYKEVDINGGNQTGVMLLQFFQKGGVRMSSNTAFIKPVRNKRKNLKVVTNARVTRVLINSKSKQAEGVEVAWEKSRSIKKKVYATKEVILSSGAIKSPHLLMLSGIGPRSTLASAGIKVLSDLPVGQNLQDHVSGGGLQVVLGKTQDTLVNDTQLIADITEYIQTHNGPLASAGPLEVSAYINSRYADPSEDYPDIQYYFPPVLVNKTKQGESSNTIFSYYNAIQVLPTGLKPKSRGYITIESKDPFIQPLIYPKYFENTQDLYTIIDGYKFVAEELCNTKVFKGLGMHLDETPLPNCAHLKFGTEEYWICAVRNYTVTTHHFSGSCKMGLKDDDTAVVDPELRVIGIKNLRVADASIMPLVGNANTAAPALMIGEKAADLIKRSWQ